MKIQSSPILVGVSGVLSEDSVGSSREIIAVGHIPNGGLEIVAQSTSNLDGTFSIDLGGFSSPVYVIAIDDYGTIWKANTSYGVNDVVHPTTSNGYGYKCIVAGQSGGTEPGTWETASNVTDNEITWQPEIYRKPVAHGPYEPKLIISGSVAIEDSVFGYYEEMGLDSYLYFNNRTITENNQRVSGRNRNILVDLSTTILSDTVDLVNNTKSITLDGSQTEIAFNNLFTTAEIKSHSLSVFWKPSSIPDGEWCIGSINKTAGTKARIKYIVGNTSSGGDSTQGRAAILVYDDSDVLLASAESTTQLDANTLYHLVFTLDLENTLVSITVNGVLEDSNPITIGANTEVIVDSFILGAGWDSDTIVSKPTGSLEIPGILWDKVITILDAQYLYHLSSNLTTSYSYTNLKEEGVDTGLVLYQYQWDLNTSKKSYFADSSDLGSYKYVNSFLDSSGQVWYNRYVNVSEGLVKFTLLDGSEAPMYYIRPVLDTSPVALFMFNNVQTNTDRVVNLVDDSYDYIYQTTDYTLGNNGILGKSIAVTPGFYVDDSVNDMIHQPNPAAAIIWVEPTINTSNASPSSSDTGGTKGTNCYWIGSRHEGSGSGIGLSVGLNQIGVVAHGDYYMPMIGRFTRSNNGFICVAINLKPDNYVDVYVDGKFLSTTQYSARTPNSLTFLPEPNYNTLTGSINSIVGYGRNLTAQEITDVYNYGIYGYNNPTSEMTSLDINTTGGGVYTEDVNDIDFTFTGDGFDGTNDSINFYYKKVNGNFEIKTRIQSFSNDDAFDGKAGIFIRESLTSAGGKCLFFGRELKTSNKVFIVWDGDESGYAESEISGTNLSQEQLWIRLKREGTSLVGYYSTNGSTWNTFNVVDLDMTADLYIGIGGCNSGGTATTATMLSPVITTKSEAGVSASETIVYKKSEMSRILDIANVHNKWYFMPEIGSSASNIRRADTIEDTTIAVGPSVRFCYSFQVANDKLYFHEQYRVYEMDSGGSTRDSNLNTGYPSNNFKISGGNILATGRSNGTGSDNFYRWINIDTFTSYSMTDSSYTTCRTVQGQGGITHKNRTFWCGSTGNSPNTGPWPFYRTDDNTPYDGIGAVTVIDTGVPFVTSPTSIKVMVESNGDSTLLWKTNKTNDFSVSFDDGTTWNAYKLTGQMKFKDPLEVYNGNFYSMVYDSADFKYKIVVNYGTNSFVPLIDLPSHDILDDPGASALNYERIRFFNNRLYVVGYATASPDYGVVLELIGYV